MIRFGFPMPCNKSPCSLPPESRCANSELNSFDRTCKPAAGRQRLAASPGEESLLAISSTAGVWSCCALHRTYLVESASKLLTLDYLFAVPIRPKSRISVFRSCLVSE